MCRRATALPVIDLVFGNVKNTTVFKQDTKKDDVIINSELLPRHNAQQMPEDIPNSYNEQLNDTIQYDQKETKSIDSMKCDNSVRDSVSSAAAAAITRNQSKKKNNQNPNKSKNSGRPFRRIMLK